jgi:hypothetical protein
MVQSARYLLDCQGGGKRRAILEIHATLIVPSDEPDRGLILHQVLTAPTTFSLDLRPLHPRCLYLNKARWLSLRNLTGKGFTVTHGFLS